MVQRKIIHDDADPARKIYPDMPNYFSNDAEFIALVEEGIASLEEGPTVDHATLFAELRQVAHGKA
jgi:hypothetical protein